VIEADLHARLGDFHLDVRFSVPARGVTALYGRSGTGKTSLLRCMAGLEKAAGSLVIGGETWQDDGRDLFLPSHRRPLGYVFQEASLFPHLSVEKNLAYGWKRVPVAERRVDYARTLVLLGLERLLERRPDGLSGGERQRVAIARALLTSPRLLLMDEPLSALDGSSKAEILPYLEHLRDQLDIPVLYVSHAVEEVARLADQMVLLEAGQVRAVGPVDQLFARLDLPIARSEEAEVVIDTRVVGRDDEFALTRLEFSGGQFAFYCGQRQVGERVRLRIYARDVSIALTRRDDSSILNVIPARVVEIADIDPARQLVKLATGPEGEGAVIIARITRKSVVHLGLEPGKPVFAQVKSVALVR
jgi:molybdate transport system ATP-binding protein